MSLIESGEGRAFSAASRAAWARSGAQLVDTMDLQCFPTPQTLDNLFSFFFFLFFPDLSHSC